eukprot:CAMPEP_0198349408 /NCGR_PEP_ID=MMETSP1450-20131203/94010_1 /TAXON_ID=753684 ORGANISM="Madagascaria erythrocladiodes, Strain CCMP3234" /NCGR_SAMPLE_ID=MMETSP1450 /ASSEMBLY_ACC=CAM_ASM_001115 /LENGTH=40 /DNA_ID= /DNA_START= /DNA_END= /DNA_ORIENTATION=
MARSSACVNCGMARRASVSPASTVGCCMTVTSGGAMTSSP